MLKIVLCLAIAPILLAQALDSGHPFGVITAVQPAQVSPGGKGALAVTITILEGWHANPNVVTDPKLVPTTFTTRPAASITWGASKYPDAKTVTESDSADPIKVFQDGAVILVPFTVAKTAKPGDITLRGDLQAQICNHGQCYPAAKVTVTAKLTVPALP